MQDSWNVYDDNTQVLVQGLEALCILCVDAHTKSYAHKRGAVETVVQALERHPQDTQIQEGCCEILWLLGKTPAVLEEKTEIATLPRTRAVAVQDRAVRAVARAVESNKNLRVQKTGLAYLSNISMEARD